MIHRELPDNWAIQGGPELKDYFKKIKILYLIGYDSNRYYYFNSEKKWTWTGFTQDRTVITLEQYLSYIERPIIGYKLIKPEYIPAIKEITHGFIFAKDKERGYIFLLKEYPKAIKLLEEAEVLDLWFEPVYEEEKKLELPSIGNRSGVVSLDFIVYGCQSVHISLFDKSICDLRLLNVYENTIGTKVIEQIREYLYENKHLNK